MSLAEAEREGEEEGEEEEEEEGRRRRKKKKEEEEEEEEGGEREGEREQRTRKRKKGTEGSTDNTGPGKDRQTNLPTACVHVQYLYHYKTQYRRTERRIATTYAHKKSGHRRSSDTNQGEKCKERRVLMRVLMHAPFCLGPTTRPILLGANNTRYHGSPGSKWGGRSATNHQSCLKNHRTWRTKRYNNNRRYRVGIRITTVNYNEQKDDEPRSSKKAVTHE